MTRHPETVSVSPDHEVRRHRLRCGVACDASTHKRIVRAAHVSAVGREAYAAFLIAPSGTTPAMA